jgi:Carboxypeptidase regulatory-like domain/TonB dependent receptor
MYGQQFGEITGTVTDSTGAVIEGALVTVRNPATGQVRNARSNQTGTYSLPYLIPGTYDIRAEKAGFKVSAGTGVDVQVGSVDRMDFKLEVGELSQQVEVSAGAPLLTTESVAVGSVIEAKQIVNLPLNGRDYLNLVTLSPNAVGEAPAGGGSGLQGGVRAQQSISIAGQRLEYNHYTLDGVENTDPNFNSYIIHPSVDAIQEFKVQTGIYSAEYGRGASQINATTISGSNQYHFVAFEFIRNSAVDAEQWKQIGAKPPFRRNDYGFTLGGPVSIPKLFNGKDRLFFMSNFEALRDRLTSQVLSSFMTAAMRQGNFSQTPNIQTIYDPLSRVTNANGPVTATPFSGQIIPASRINPAAISLMNYYPLPTVPGNSILSNYAYQAPQPTDSTQFNQRIDFNENTKSSWFGRFSWGSDLQVPSAADLQVSSHTGTTVRQAVLVNTRTFGNSVVNEARFAWNQFNNDLVGYYANQLNVQGTLGITGLSADGPLNYGVPAMGIGGGLSFPGGVTPWVTRDDVFQWVDGVSIIKGSHSFKVGGEFRRNRYNQWGNQKATGEFDFDGQSTANPAQPTSTGYAPADFLVGLPSQAYRVVTMADAMMRSNFFSAYFQDDWKVTPKLTLNLGLRYENQRPWHDKYNALVNVQVFTEGVGSNGVVPGAKAPIICRPGNEPFYAGLKFQYAQGQGTESGCGLGNDNVYNADNRNFGPRIGVAWSPGNHWSVRAGGGIFYVQDVGNIVFDMARNIGGRDGNIIGASQRTTLLNAPWASESGSPLCPGYPGVCLNAPQLLANYQGNKTPYVTQYLFNVQRELTQNLVLEVGYLGNEGHHLDRFIIFNQAVPKTGPTDTSSITARRPFPAFGPIQEVAGVDNSNYNALSAKLTQRFSHGLIYLVAFTWSKAIDLGSATRTNGSDLLWPTNSYDLGILRGPSEFNLPRRFVASVVYELPFGPGKPLVNQGLFSHIAGGWQLGGIVVLADGTSLNPATIGDTASVGTLSNQIDATGVSPFLSNPTAQKFWNIAAFNAIAPDLAWKPGNMGRDTLFTPGTTSFDSSLSRTIRIKENHAVNIRFEAFNTLNHPNWNTPSSNSQVPTAFGVVTSARTMRQLQAALKYSF